MTLQLFMQLHLRYPLIIEGIITKKIPNTRRRPKPAEKFECSHIFTEDTTLSNVFEKTTSPLITRLLEGKDSLLFTMGVTGSGKVHLCVYSKLT
jgi:Kinesin motor domain